MSREITVQIGDLLLNSYTEGQAVPLNTILLQKTPDIITGLNSRSRSAARRGEHGSTSSLSFYENRVLSFEGFIYAESQEKRVEIENNIKKTVGIPRYQSIDGDNGFKKLIITLEDGTAVQIYARVLDEYKANVVDNSDPTMREFSFTMEAVDPFFVSTTLKSNNGNEGSLGTNFRVVNGSLPTFPFNIAMEYSTSTTPNNRGTAEAAPIITVFGPTTDIIIENKTTGVFFEFENLELEEGEWVKIDTSKLTIVDQDGVDQSAKWTDESNFIYLVPGENEFSFTDETPQAQQGTVQIDWRDTYR